MGDVSWKKVEQIVDEILDLPAGQRHAYIEQTCGHDQRLKGEVTQLIESIFDSEGWLTDLNNHKYEFYNDVSEDIQSLSANQDFIGRQVGSYTIKEKIGQGGMGLVYLAKRTDDNFDHQVAIKIIRDSQATDANIQRFRREQHILAGLNHPGIAHLYDGGITSEGSPYIIMEYVCGIPITEYCRTHNSSIKERIDLFKQVLEAVRYAHENLVIHRDLKPDNILVDESGKVKILDFGISKLLHDEDDLSLTQTGARVLTPKYAAPEQIKQTNITTATDLYSLGVIFYELLSDKPPFDLDNCTTYQAEQIILKQAPAKPSNKTSDKKLGQKLRGDLDSIALKAIRKESKQRYRVASEFLKDLDNYLNDLPVSARTDSFRYRTSKFIGRHKQNLSIAAVTLILIVGFSGFYTVRLAEEKNRAQLQQQHAEEITSFLLSLFDANKPRENLGEDPPVSIILERGLQKIEEEPIALHNKAMLLGAIGQIQIKMGKTSDAEPIIKQAYQIASTPSIEQTPSLIDIYTIYGDWYHSTGVLDSARYYFYKADSLHTALGSTNTEEYRVNLLNLANVQNEEMAYHQALSTLGQLENKFPDERKETLHNKSYLLNNQAIAHVGLGNHDQALEKYQEALNIKERIYDKDNPEIALIYHNMAKIYLRRGDSQESYNLYKKALKIRRKAFDKDHALISSSLQGVAIAANDLGKNSEAEAAYQESIRSIKKQNGSKHYRYALALRNYAQFLIKLEEFDRAEKMLNTSQDIITNLYGKNHTIIAYIVEVKASLYEALNNPEEVAKNYTIASNILEQNLGVNNIALAKIKTKHGIFEFERKQYKSALSLLDTAANIFDSSSEHKSYYSGKTQYYLGKTHLEMNQHDLAKQYLQNAYQIIRSTKGDTFNLSIETKKLLAKLP